MNIITSERDQARHIIAFGGSAGGIEALLKLLPSLPASLDVAVFITQHISPHRNSELPKVLQRGCQLQVEYARDREIIRKGRVYIAPPDKHLIVRKDAVALGFGPRENRMRPAVDVLFRSAAHAYGSRVIGIVLSGSSNDGALGSVSIKRHGGIIIAQDPQEALFNRMPLSVIDHAPADHVVRVKDIAKLVIELARDTITTGGEGEMSDSSNDIATGATAGISAINAPPSALTCPACGGAVWESTINGLSQFRCHQGHSYTSELMLEEYDEQLESVARVLSRLLEETHHLRLHMAEFARSQGKDEVARALEQRASLNKRQYAIIHELLNSETDVPKGV